MFKNIKADLRTYEGYWGTPGFWVMITYRFGRWRWKVKPVLFRKVFSLIFRIVHKTVMLITGIELPEQVEVGKNFRLEHFGGIIISDKARFGDNCIVRDGVTVGTRRLEEDGAPNIGNDVEIGTGAKVLGKIRIGNNVKIGANAVVLIDVPDNSVAVGIPAIIKKRRLKNKNA